VTSRQIERFKRRLIDDIAAIYRSVHVDVREVQATGLFEKDEARDEVDESQQMQQRDLRLSLAENEARRAQAMEAALRRIAAGTFGECIDCGNRIELTRLKLVPWTPRCFECQEGVEREARGRAPRL
jgi:DnaK suppressor protein